MLWLSLSHFNFSTFNPCWKDKLKGEKDRADNGKHFLFLIEDDEQTYYQLKNVAGPTRN